MQSFKSIALALLQIGLVDGESYFLTKSSNDLYFVKGFINEGNSTTYKYSNMTETKLLLDTINAKTFLFPNGTCDGCPSTRIGIAPGMVQSGTSIGVVSFGLNGRVSGRWGTTGMGLGAGGDEILNEPTLHWLQHMITVTKATNLPPANDLTYSGNLALGRAYSDGWASSAYGSMALYPIAQVPFCIDFNYIASGSTLHMGSKLCEDYEKAYCNQRITVPIFDTSEPTWNVAVSSLQWANPGRGPFLQLSAKLVMDTTTSISVFPKAVADTLASWVAGPAPLTTTYQNGFYNYTFTALGPAPGSLLINFSNENPFTPSNGAKFYQVRSSQLAQFISRRRYTMTFLGSSDGCIVGSRPDGVPTVKMGTLFMANAFFSFHVNRIDFIQRI